MIPTISPATQADIAQMISICAQNLVENNRGKFDANDFATKGFLIRKTTEADVQEILSDQKNHFACVAKNDEEVLGYLIGCDSSKTEIDFFKHAPELEKLKNHKIFYHKQIVKKPDAKNIGSKLLFAMFDEAKRRNYLHVVCRIVHKPFFNQASVSFHEKFGFKEIGMMEENGLRMGIYLKKLSEI